METIIKTTNLSCKSGKRHLLKQINWEVKKGEHWVIFGMNGSGKTTLLSIIAGFKAYTSGDLEVFGQHYSNENILQLRRKIGWVSSSFFDRYLKEESARILCVRFDRVHWGWTITLPLPMCAERKHCCGSCCMDGKMDRPFDTMSKGERQNVLISRALISKPEILVLDEPGTGLDVYAREHMLNTVKALADSDMTILYVTHYPEEIQPLFSKAMLLRNGRIYAQGNTSDVLTGEKISALMEEEVEVLHNEDGRLRMKMNAPSNIKEICFREEV